MVDEKDAGHPLDRQNEIERAIQLEGPKDPDKFKMPDGRSLTEVRQANQAAQVAEYQEEIKMVSQRTREQSIPEFQKGEKLVMTKSGNLIDVTEPKESDVTITLAESRTTSAEIDEGVIKPRAEGTGTSGSVPTGEVSSSSGAPLGSANPSATPSSPVGATSPGTTTPSTSGR